MHKQKKILLTGLVCGSFFLAGCASSGNIKNGTIGVSTMTSPDLVLPASAFTNKTIYVTVKNITAQSLNFLPALDTALQKNGYTVVTDPSSANEILEVDVLQAGKNSMSNIRLARSAGPGSTLSASRIDNTNLLSSNNDLGVAITNAWAQNLTYSIIIDMKLRLSTGTEMTQAPAQIQSVDNTAGAVTAVATQANMSQTIWNNYDARIIAYATQVNIPFSESVDALSNSLVSKISAILSPRTLTVMPSTVLASSS